MTVFGNNCEVFLRYCLHLVLTPLHISCICDKNIVLIEQHSVRRMWKEFPIGFFSQGSLRIVSLRKKYKKNQFLSICYDEIKKEQNL